MMDCRFRWYFKRVVPSGSPDEIHLLKEGTIRVGRGANTDIKCSCIQVSRLHCELIVQNDQVAVVDHDSFNGTYLNDIKLPPMRQLFLHAGDKIGMGVKAKDFSESYVFELIREELPSLPDKIMLGSPPSSGLKRKRNRSLEFPSPCSPKSRRLSYDTPKENVSGSFNKTVLNTCSKSVSTSISEFPVVDLTSENCEVHPKPNLSIIRHIDLTSTDYDDEPEPHDSSLGRGISNTVPLLNVTVRKKKEHNGLACGSIHSASKTEFNGEISLEKSTVLQSLCFSADRNHSSLSETSEASTKNNIKPPVSSKLSFPTQSTAIEHLPVNNMGFQDFPLIKQEPGSPKCSGMSFSTLDEIIILDDSDTEEPASQLFSPKHKVIRAVPMEEDIEVDILNVDNDENIEDDDSDEFSLFEEHFSQCSQQVFDVEDDTKKLPPLPKHHVFIEKQSDKEVAAKKNKKSRSKDSISSDKKEKTKLSFSDEKIVEKEISVKNDIKKSGEKSSGTKKNEVKDKLKSPPSKALKPPTKKTEGPKTLKICSPLPLPKTSSSIKPAKAVKKNTDKGMDKRATRSNKSLVDTTLFGKSDKKKIIEGRKEKLKSLAIKNKDTDQKDCADLKVPPVVCAKITEQNRGDFLLRKDDQDTTHSANTCVKVTDPPPTFKIKKIVPQKGTDNSKEKSTGSIDGPDQSGATDKNDTRLSNEVTKNLKKTTKKKVMFASDSNLCEVRIYECEGELKKLSFFKDFMMPPKPLPLSGCLSTDVSSSVDELLYDICHWNTCWIEESKMVPGDPPLYPPCKELPLVKNEYTSISDYNRTFYPHMLSELWNSLLQDITIQDRCGFIPFHGAIEASEVKQIPRSSGPRSFIRAYGFITFRKEDLKKSRLPVTGDYVLVNCKTHLPDNKHALFSSFAFVNRVQKVTKISYLRSCHSNIPQLQATPTLDANNDTPQADSFVNISFQFCYSAKKIIRPGSKIVLRVLRNLNKDIRLFASVQKGVPSSPLHSLILSPPHFIANINSTAPNLISEFPLDSSQEKAVLDVAQSVLSSTPSINLIHGPPGAGKSQVIISLIMQILYSDKRKSLRKKSRPKILLCAPSNTAVDELVLRLLALRQQMPYDSRFKLARHGRKESMHPIVREVSSESLAERDVIKTLKDPDYTKVQLSVLKAHERALSLSLDNTKDKSVQEKYLEKQAILQRKIQDFEAILKSGTHSAIDLNDPQVKRQIKEAENYVLFCADIVATTLSSSFSPSMVEAYSRTEESKKPNFACCIIDEATQATEPESLIPLLIGTENLVFVGDPHQLPPTVISQACKEKQFTKSFYSRFFSAWEVIFGAPLHFLQTQYRMHPEIASWPSKYFYQNKLITSPTLNVSYSFHPYLIFQHKSKQDPNGESNKDESLMVANLVTGIFSHPIFKNSSIGVIVPYQKQKHAIGQLFKDWGLITRTSPVVINTIDSFQGQEKDVIILSCVRTDGIGFLSDSQRLNVALTRAKKALYVFANFSSFKNNPMWSDMFDDARKRGKVIQIDVGHTSDQFLNEVLCQT